MTRQPTELTDPFADPLSLPGSQEQPQQNALAMLHRRLRGRYPIAIALAVILGGFGAYFGYKARQTEFTSTGIVQVRPKQDSLIYESDDLGTGKIFDGIVKAEATILGSRRVLELACENQDLLKVGWPTGINGISQMMKTIKVKHKRGEQLISVEANHPDKRLAKAAVNAVLDAYHEIHGEKMDIKSTQDLRRLETVERDLSNQVASIRDQIHRIAEDFGVDGLERRHRSKLEELDRLDVQVASYEAAIDTAQRREAGLQLQNEESGRDAADEVALEVLAAKNPAVAALLDREAYILAEIEAQSARFGKRHRLMVSLERELQQVRAQIRLELDQAMAMGDQRPGDAKGAAAGLAQMSTADLQELLRQMQSRREDVNGEVIRISRKLVEIERLSEELKEKKQTHDDASQKLTQRRIESQNVSGSLVSIVQRGDLPITPNADKRKAMAAAGALFGGGLGFGVVLLLGIMDRGYRYIDDIESDSLSAPLLGTLPDLTRKSEEQDEMAALSVHHLRNTLQMKYGAENDKCEVFTITSASAGDGKTSLALALGMSFAVSGRRTLLLDADLVGRGLSAELGHARQDGLAQAIQHGELNGEVQPSSVPNLWMLPAGLVDEVEAKHLSQEGVASVLDHLRTQFETILIDTGPLLGSLEANIVATLSDGVLVTVARGQDHRLVEACLERLQRISAECAGLVFNRASSSDFERSVSAASFCSQSLKSQGEGGRSRTGRSALVRAVIGESGQEAEVSAHS